MTDEVPIARFHDRVTAESEPYWRQAELQRAEAEAKRTRDFAIVRMLRSHGPHNAGERVGFSMSVAAGLVASNVASFKLTETSAEIEAAARKAKAKAGFKRVKLILDNVPSLPGNTRDDVLTVPAGEADELVRTGAAVELAPLASRPRQSLADIRAELARK